MIRIIGEPAVVPYDFTPGSVDFLLGVKDERVTIAITFKAEWFIKSNADTKSVFSGNDITINDGDDDALINAWPLAEFRVGDVITITLSASNNVTRNITAISTDGATITVDGAALTPETSTAALLNGETPLTGVSFKYNFIENDAAIDYNSLIDGNENKYSLAGLTFPSMGSTATNHQGNYKSNKIGTVVIEGTANLNEFIITQDINLIPFVLAGELPDIQNGIAPEYYFDLSCLKYIYEITLHKTLVDPNYVHVTRDDIFKDGNTGWFDENFNGGSPEYSLTSTVFKNASGDIIAKPDYSLVNTVELTLNSASGLFVDILQKFTLQHAYIPIDSTEYINTSTDVETNFMFDQQVTVVEDPAVNGRGFGTAKQVLTDIFVDYLTPNDVIITAKLDLSAEYQARMASLEGNFYLGVTTQRFGLTTETSDKVHVLSALTNYIKDVSDPLAGGIETCFISHPETDANPPLVPGDYATLSGGLGLPQVTTGLTHLLYDLTQNIVIAVADWQGSFSSTMNKLRDSLNDNVSYGTVFGSYPAYVNNGGYNTATVVFSGGRYWVNFLAPTTGTVWNGQALQIVSSDLNLSNNFMQGGTNDTDPLVCSSESGTFVEDWQIGKSIFFVEDPADSVIKSITVRIFASHATYGEFDLELRAFSVEDVPVVSGIQVISISGLKGYQMAAGNIFNEISIARRTDLDTGTKKYYQLLYPFKIRWEDFTSLPGASNQFYAPTEPQNGLNNDWSRYYAAAGWSLNYKVSTVITKDAFDNTISLQSDVVALTYGAADDWSYTAHAYDLETGLEVTGNAMSDRPYTIKFKFTKTIGAEPALDKITGYLGVAPTNAGGQNIIEEVSTTHVFPDTTPWISILDNKLLKKEKVGSEYILSAVIDNVKLRNKFPTAISFDFTGRIEEALAEKAKLFGNSQPFKFGNGQQYLFG